MITIPGYKLQEEIFRSSTSTIYRGTRVLDNIPIIVKLLNNEYPSKNELSDFYREFEIAQKLRGDGIIRVYCIERSCNSLAIIMEDIGGQSLLHKAPSSVLSLSERIMLAVKATAALTQVHQQNVIHKDVNPSNFIWNENSGQLKIIDFGISSELSLETPQYTSTNILEGTIPYISPEQTGRMNRPIDYRTDLYSLGVMLYELFTGQLPFTSDNDMEIVYCHIARTPFSPFEINSEIPYALSAIVMKLLSKTAEDRYQSALGVKKDLEYCLYHMDTGAVEDHFLPGQYDVNERFQISHKLYGREADIGILLDRFERCTQGNSEFLLVSGYSGIGKSSIINEIRKPATGKNGIVISGKFDQLECNIPYFAIIQAFRGLIKQLLSESQKKLEYWKSKLTDALGYNGQIIIDIIPELERIIGAQQDVIALNPVEAQNRFQITFREFLKVFAKQEHPLVIFLDDLQWGDLSTFDLLKYLLENNDLKYVLFIGAYRDNEVHEGHPLLQLLNELKSVKKSDEEPFHHLFIKPLGFEAINQMIADAFRCSPANTEALSNLVFSKTKGNPFFTNQVLNTLYYQKIFTFDSDKRKWKWDLEKAKQVDISDNVVDFLVKDIELLPAGTIEMLTLSACIGNQFGLSDVAVICEKTFSDLNHDIRIAIEKGFISPTDRNYRFINLQNILPSEDIHFSFSHDRIQQAAYSLIPDDKKKAIHLKIGRHLLESLDHRCLSVNIFDIVNHLNASGDLVSGFKERCELSNLNILAGNKAQKSTAFTTACNYFEIARTILSEPEWACAPEKFFNVTLQQATAALLAGNLIKSGELCNYLSSIAKNNIEKGSISNVKVLLLEFQARQLEAIEEIRLTLKLFGINLPENHEEIQQKIQDGIIKMQMLLAKTPIDELVNLPEMKDPEKLMTMQLLFQLIPPALQTNPPLYILASLMMFDLSVHHGTTALSCKCFSDCGVIQGAMLGDYITGYKFGEAAFELIGKYNADALKPSVYFVFTYISYWRVHFRESINYYDMSYRTGLRTGDIQHAAYALAHKVHLMVNTGNILADCMAETKSAMAFLRDSKTAVPFLLARIVHNAINKLTIENKQGEQVDFQKTDQEILDTINSIHNMVFLGRFFQYNTLCSVIHGDWQEAEKWNQMAENIIFVGLSDFPVPDHYLFQGLIITQKWNSIPEEKHEESLKVLSGILSKLQKWMENSPSNFSHKYYLLSARIAIVKKESIETITELFKNAIGSIENDDFLHMKALCNELQGVFWLERGNETIGKTFIRESHYQYNQWGASRKTAQLEQKFSNYISSPCDSGKKTRVPQTTSSNSIDISSLLKSTHAISSEIKIEKLLTILIYTIVENAGAQRGCLLLQNDTDNQLYIEAIQESDKVAVMNSILYTECNDICKDIVQYVARTRECLLINDACNDINFQNNSYVVKNNTKSVLCMPVFLHNNFKGIVYLENNLSDNVFTAERLEILKMLSSQAAISIENARLYENMEENVRERTIQLKEANEKLKELSLHDPLTNLHNRRYTYEYITEFTTKYIKNKVLILNNANKRDLSLKNNILGVFLIDIDYFKEVNDTYGHQAGDIVLVTLSRILQTIIRSDDFIVRWGGEEFLIILNNTKPEYLKMFAEKVITMVRQTQVVISNELTIIRTCSLGYTEIPLIDEIPDLLTLEQSINLSDYALYCAKERGRNCAAHFKLNRKPGKDCTIKDLLTHLSKYTNIENENFEIEFL